MALRKIFLAASLAATGVAAPMITGDTSAVSLKASVGMKVLASRATPLRAAPPREGLFYTGRGTPLGEIQIGETFEVAAVTRVRRPLGDEVWLYLRRMGGMGGWAYAGQANRPWSNFKPLEAR